MSAPGLQRVNGGLLKQTRFAVRLSPESDKLVQLIAGDATITMEHDAALRISQLLRVFGKQAKNHAGDKGVHWSTIGVLTDAEENYRRGL